MFDDKTVPAIVTLQQIEKAEKDFQAYLDGTLELDRFIGTIETWGAYNNCKPEYSSEYIGLYAEVISFIKKT